MHPDPKIMSTEEVASKADKILESIRNNLKTFLGDGLSAGSSETTRKHGIYSAPSTVPDKRQQFKQDLTLIEEGRQELQQAVQESLDSSKLVSPEKHSP